MNQKNIEKDPGRRSSDRKQAFGGSNLVWSLIAVAVAGLFAASLFSTGQKVQLSYTDLERLIRAAGEKLGCAVFNATPATPVFPAGVLGGGDEQSASQFEESSWVV